MLLRIPMKKLLFYISILLFMQVKAQSQVSVMQEESAYYRSLGHDGMAYYTFNTPAAMPPHKRAGCALQKTVLGWHPYWGNGLEVNYDWDLLSDFVYFSYEVNPLNGQPNSTYNFLTVPSVTAALANNVKVHLCVTLFSDHATFFSNAAARNTLVNNLIALLQARGAHGINIDFEGVSVSQQAAFTAFLVQLGTALHNAGNYQLSVCLYAVDWSNLFQEPLIEPYVDFFTIMGYDYYYSGSTQAGPTDPLYGFTTAYDRSLSRSVTYYLNEGIPADKLVLGLPYYGREWNTVSASLPSNVSASPASASRTYAYVKNNASGNYTNPQLYPTSASRAYIFPSAGAYRQCFISEEAELKQRYTFVKQRNLRGIGIWALSYDDGYTQLWDALRSELTDCYTNPCADTLYDMGGPGMNYYDNEDYTYTIAPPGAVSIQLYWDQFDLENGYDSLYIYAGTQAQGVPLLAWSGNVLPAALHIGAAAFTLRFRSDGATRRPGWRLRYYCLADTTPPLTQVLPQQNWLRDSMQIQFQDSDNTQLSGQYWALSDFDGNTISANRNAGFFEDHFSTNVYNWQNYAGSWSYSGTELQQTDQGNANTNYYTSFMQTADAYVYEMEAAAGGNGTNRRFGLHFMCDDAAWPNRNNSYFVWFRIDNQQLQFYKVTNDVFQLVKTVNCTLNAGQYYRFRIAFTKQDGLIAVWKDNEYLGAWQDPQPYTTGNYVSLRTGNAYMNVRYLRIYKNRSATEYIHTGADTSLACRYQNTDPQGFAARIYSLVTDAARLMAFADSGIRVDYSPPLHTGIPGEESPDLDTLTAGTTVNLYLPLFTDIHSGCTRQFFILDAAQQVQAGPFNYTDTIQPFNLDLLPAAAYYYTAALALNGAGLYSDTLFSDGFYLQAAGTGMQHVTTGEVIQLMPNPFRDYFSIRSEKTRHWTLYDAAGRELRNGSCTGECMLYVPELASGIYYFKTGTYIMRLVKTD